MFPWKSCCGKEICRVDTVYLLVDIGDLPTYSQKSSDQECRCFSEIALLTATEISSPSAKHILSDWVPGLKDPHSIVSFG